MRRDRGSNFRKNIQHKRDSFKNLCYNRKKLGRYIADRAKPLKEELKNDKKEYPKKEWKNCRRFNKEDKGPMHTLFTLMDVLAWCFVVVLLPARVQVLD